MNDFEVERVEVKKEGKRQLSANWSIEKEVIMDSAVYAGRFHSLNEFMNRRFYNFWNRPTVVKLRKWFKIWSLENEVAAVTAEEIRKELDMCILERIKEAANK